MVNIWSTISHIIGERCPLCGQPGGGLCEPCKLDLPKNHHGCPCCALPLPVDAVGETVCADCQTRPPAFDQATVPLVYEHPIDDLISAFKYHHRLSLGRDLADLLVSAVRGRESLPQLLIPIPMHRRGLRERGFNQAAEIARMLSARLGIPWSDAHLRRHNDGNRQRGLQRHRRLRNMKGRFS